jgi:hypothetical protein
LLVLSSRGNDDPAPTTPPHTNGKCGNQQGAEMMVGEGQESCERG